MVLQSSTVRIVCCVANTVLVTALLFTISSVPLQEACLSPEERKKEQQKYGVYYDDDYNYLQHLQEPGFAASEVFMYCSPGHHVLRILSPHPTLVCSLLLHIMLGSTTYNLASSKFLMHLCLFSPKGVSPIGSVWLRGDCSRET